MREKSSYSGHLSVEQVVKDIRRATRRQFSAEERSASFWTACAASTRSPSCAGAKALPRACITAGPKSSSKRASDGLRATPRAATSSEVKDLKRQALELKEVVAEQALELRLLKDVIGDGGDEA